uniref:Uncharacterized protein n=1 Tax=Setaria italica TaxID=4555 RepID=K4A4I7_SETIT
MVTPEDSLLVKLCSVPSSNKLDLLLYLDGWVLGC